MPISYESVRELYTNSKTCDHCQSVKSGSYGLFFLEEVVVGDYSKSPLNEIYPFVKALTVFGN